MRVVVNLRYALMSSDVATRGGNLTRRIRRAPEWRACRRLVHRRIPIGATVAEEVERPHVESAAGQVIHPRDAVDTEGGRGPRWQRRTVDEKDRGFARARAATSRRQMPQEYAQVHRFDPHSELLFLRWR